MCLPKDIATWNVSDQIDPASSSLSYDLIYWGLKLIFFKKIKEAEIYSQFPRSLYLLLYFVCSPVYGSLMLNETDWIR